MKVKLLIFSLLVWLLSTLSATGQTAQEKRLIDEFNKGKKENIDARQKNSTQSVTNRSRTLSQDNTPTDNIIDDKFKFTTDSLRVMEILNSRSTDVFGRELFDKKNVSFAPVYNIPTPANYILAGGDQVLIDIWGEVDKSYDLKISPDGNINIPEVGVVHLAGLTVAQAENVVRNSVAKRNEGVETGSTKVTFSLGNIRSIKVNVIGEAAVPGTYTVPSLATLFNVLYAAGGVSDIGSLRNIKLYRNGKQVAALDVYDYLLNGKNVADIRLDDNDLVVIEPFKSIVDIRGQVRRARKYELKDGESFVDLLKISGGFDGKAYTDNVTVHRSDGKRLEIITLDKDRFEDFVLVNRDSIIVGEIVPTYTNRVTLKGAVWRPGDYQVSHVIATVGDLVRKAEGVREDAFLGRVQISRLDTVDMQRGIISVNLGDVLSGKASDVLLNKEDIVTVFSLDTLRQKQFLSIKGEVNNPNDSIPFVRNATVEDVILLANGLTDGASRARLEVFRRIKNPNSTEVSDRKALAFQFEIGEDLSIKDRDSKFRLEPFDEIVVRRSPGYIKQQTVRIKGEVVFAGEYVLTDIDNRLSTLVSNAGGLSQTAYAKGAYLRRKIGDDEQERVKAIEKIMRNMQSASKDSLKLDIEELKTSYMVGINLIDALQRPGSDVDVVLQEGDELVIPEFNNTVKISGAVYYPNAVTYMPNMSINDYINMAGGYSQQARRKPFIIYMNGMVASGNLGRKSIQPGCEIVVPQRPMSKQVTLSEILAITTSSVSMLALIANLVK